MNRHILIETASAMVASGKGILAMDESHGTCDKRFKKLGIPTTAIHIIVVPMPVPSNGPMILILIHHMAHPSLMRSVAVHPVFAALPRGPVAIDPGILSALAVALTGLV